MGDGSATADASDELAPRVELEVERKYDVDDATPVPDWTRLPEVASVGEAEPRALDAQYLDTAGMHLARARVAVRRRSGGPDEGWHIKTSEAEGRREHRWPLGDGDGVPPAVTRAVTAWTTAPLLPVARIRNARTAYALRDAAGGLVAEFVDDRVAATAARTGARRAWREWEMELGPAAPADVEVFFSRVGALVAEAGGRPAVSGSKLQRALAG